MKSTHTLLFQALPLAVLLYAPIACVRTTAPELVVPRIVSTMPGDTSGFTQGLVFDRGVLYRSDGLYGVSAVSRVDAATGEVQRRVALEAGFFGEGCALFGNDLIVLTWRERTALIYSTPDLERRGTLMYAGEGWGLATDGTVLYMSDGSDTITVRKRDFTILRRIPVRDGKTPVPKLNELEWAKGRLYANIWYSDRIAEIAPNTGRVLRYLDCSALVKQENPASPDHVLNGIAYDPARDLLYVTGKKWKRVYLVKIEP